MPLPRTPTLLTLLVQAGADLVGLHLLDARYGPASWDVGDGPFAQLAAEFVGPTSSEVTSPSFAKRAVWLDKMQTTGFRNVDEEVWNFKVGGYQVCAKWLKDRKGRTLSKDDIAHYQKIVVALSETIRLMKEIDEVIEQHGGWPAAFTSTDAESAEVTHLQAEGPWRVVKAAEEPAAYWSGGSQTDA